MPALALGVPVAIALAWLLLRGRAPARRRRDDELGGYGDDGGGYAGSGIAADEEAFRRYPLEGPGDSPRNGHRAPGYPGGGDDGDGGNGDGGELPTDTWTMVGPGLLDPGPSSPVGLDAGKFVTQGSTTMQGPGLPAPTPLTSIVPALQLGSAGGGSTDGGGGGGSVKAL